MKKWFKAAGIRAIRTMAQAALGYIAGSALLSEVDWQVVISASLLAAITSMLMSIAGLPELKEEATNDELEDAWEEEGW